jgi:hypothetical protein
MTRDAVSLKLHLRLEYEPVGMACGYRILGWSRTFGSTAKGLRSLNTWIGQFMGENIQKEIAS